MTTLMTADTTAPTITGTPTVITVTDTLAVVRWLTDEKSDSRLYYGIQGLGMIRFEGDLVPVTEHTLTLANLTPGSTYEFSVSSVDAFGNQSAPSSPITFVTGGISDNTGPTITNIGVSDITYTSAIVTWDTDEFATSHVIFGPDTGNLNGVAANGALTQNHTVVLTGLAGSTTYNFIAVCLDQSGNLTESAMGQFVTLQAGPDTDGDGVPDVDDAFPNDNQEWEDLDGDGLGDNFEQLIIQVAQNDANPANDWILTLADVVGDDDFDNDGFTNEWEFQHNTDPTSTDPPLPVANSLLLMSLILILALIGLFRDNAKVST